MYWPPLRPDSGTDDCDFCRCYQAKACDRDIVSGINQRDGVAGCGGDGSENHFRHGAISGPAISSRSCREKTGLFGDLFPET